MFSEPTRETPGYHIPPPTSPTPMLLEVAQKYVGACDHFDRLQMEMAKLNEEMKQVDNARREFREQLLHLINQAVDGPAVAKARPY